MVSRALLLKKKTHNTTLAGGWSELTGLTSHLSGLCSLWQGERRPAASPPGPRGKTNSWSKAKLVACVAATAVKHKAITNLCLL